MREMPNHVTNRIYFPPNIKKGMLEKLTSVDEKQKRYVDFNNLIPTPDYIYQGNLGIEERKKYGKNNWYDWRCENWGTKWNAYETQICEDYIQFCTAWNVPTPVLKKLSEKFPQNKIALLVNNEGSRYNFGIIFENGKEIVNRVIDSTAVLSYMLRDWLDYEALIEIIESEENADE
jgi:hypothetical protein